MSAQPLKRAVHVSDTERLISLRTKSSEFQQEKPDIEQ